MSHGCGKATERVTVSRVTMSTIVPVTPIVTAASKIVKLRDARESSSTKDSSSTTSSAPWICPC